MQALMTVNQRPAFAMKQRIAVQNRIAGTPIAWAFHQSLQCADSDVKCESASADPHFNRLFQRLRMIFRDY